MAFIIFIFFVAAAISTVAAWFSLAGMGALFAATFWGVVIMAGTLEVGKIVATKWVHSNWRNPRAPWYFRGLFCVFIAALMTITSLGIYGYLSKGHLEQAAPKAGLEIQSAQLETQLKQKQAENDQLMKRMDQISRITDKSLETSGRQGLRAANSQRREAAAIQARIDENNKAINDLNTKLVPLKTQGAEVEAKLGPVKYVAELFGWDPESAVRIIIVIIMIAFDPLALSLFIAGSISLKDYQEARKRKAEEPLVTGDNIPQNVFDTMKPEWVDHVRKLMEQEDIKEKEAAYAEHLFSEKPADAVLDEMTPIEGEGASIAPEEDRAARFISDDTGVTIIEGEGEGINLLEDHQESLNLIGEEESKLDRDTIRAEIASEIEAELQDVEAQRTQNAEDREALEQAHSQLLTMEARLNDERELLGQWEEQLKQQQEAINAWKPEPKPQDDDPRSPKEMIIEVLEMNPDIVNDIVQVAIAMQNARPGL
jgi:hypothetical protein